MEVSCNHWMEVNCNHKCKREPALRHHGPDDKRLTRVQR